MNFYIHCWSICMDSWVQGVCLQGTVFLYYYFLLYITYYKLYTIKSTSCNARNIFFKAPQNNNLRFFYAQKRRWKRCTWRQFPTSFRNLREMELPFRKRECVYCWSTTWTCAVESSSSVWLVIKRYMYILIPWERFW